jgi:hypothetical protein
MSEVTKAMTHAANPPHPKALMPGMEKNSTAPMIVTSQEYSMSVAETQRLMDLSKRGHDAHQNHGEGL